MWLLLQHALSACTRLRKRVRWFYFSLTWLAESHTMHGQCAVCMVTSVVSMLIVITAVCLNHHRVDYLDILFLTVIVGTGCRVGNTLPSVIGLV